MIGSCHRKVNAEQDGTIQVLGGPISAVKSKTYTYVVIVPGDLIGKELAKRVFRGLAGKAPKELCESVLKLSVEEVREFIPYGKGRILEEKV